MRVLNPSYKLDLLELGITGIPVGGLLRVHTTASFQERKPGHQPTALHRL